MRLNTTHFFITNIPNTRELHQVIISNSLDIEFDEFKRLYRKCTAKSISNLAFDTVLPSDNELSFRKNLLDEV